MYEYIYVCMKFSVYGMWVSKLRVCMQGHPPVVIDYEPKSKKFSIVGLDQTLCKTNPAQLTYSTAEKRRKLKAGIAPPEPCYFFAKGECAKGDNCKFLHVAVSGYTAAKEGHEEKMKH